MKSCNDQRYVEELARGKPIAGLTVHYHGVENSKYYKWEDRKYVNWDNIRRLRLDFVTPNQYLKNGDACSRPWFRVK